MSPDQTRPSPEPFNFQTYSSPGEPGPSSYQSPDAAQLDQDDFNVSFVFSLFFWPEQDNVFSISLWSLTRITHALLGQLHGFNPLEYPLPVVRCDDCQRPILQSAILNHAGTWCPLLRDRILIIPPENSSRLTRHSWVGAFGTRLANCERVRTLEQAALEDDGRSLLSVGLSSNKRRLSNSALLLSSSPPGGDLLLVVCLTSRPTLAASMSDVSSPPPHPKRTKLATDPPSPAPSRASLAAAGAGSDTGGGGHSSSALEIEARKAIDKKLLKEAQRAEKKGERSPSLPFSLTHSLLHRTP